MAAPLVALAPTPGVRELQPGGPVRIGKEQTMTQTPDRPADRRSEGLAAGGRGGPEEELLEDGQEEVFSRTEVELGRIEHKSEAGGSADDEAPFGQPSG